MEAATEETQKESPENVQPNTTATEKTSTPPPALEVKKGKRVDRTKRDDKNVEQFMKSLNSVPTLEEKLSLVCKKYVQTADDNKKMQFYIKQSDKRHAMLLKEKDQLQLEFNKTILVKSKLENLCRELQKQNKAIKEESLLKIREEEERRKETQAKFQNTLSEITAMLQQNNEKNAKLRDDNITMSEKFKSVVAQYQLREQQVDKMAKQMALESQLSDAKLQKASLEHQADKERLLAEMEQVKVTLAQYRAKIMELQGIETSLRGQLAVYTDKYDEFQNALVKSNQMFGGFKEQMDQESTGTKTPRKRVANFTADEKALLAQLIKNRPIVESKITDGKSVAKKQTAWDIITQEFNCNANVHKMSKKIKKLEKESLSWKTRWETSQTALLDMCGERQASEERAAAAARQLQHMQGLCRTLQAERTVLLSTLKDNNIERPPVPAAPPAPPAPAPAPLAQQPASNAKVDAMAANCAQLRQSLAHLQSQLNTLTNKQKEESPAPEKPEKTEKKKSKSKKNKAEKAKAEAEKAASAAAEAATAEATTAESDDAKKVIKEIQPNTSEDTIQNETEKVDEKTLENLLQAINNANINLCDLEVVTDEISEETSQENSEKVEINEVKTEVEVKESTSNGSLSASPVEETLPKDTEDTSTVDDTIETNIKDVNEVITKYLNEVKVVSNEVKEISNINGCEDVNVSIVESSNEEVSHLNEVKPIVSDA